ncbi:MAG: hypothetical protein DWQ06_12810 [Calditrichaeota bacterium]|nr:MAG: hypothetical protein DWQ06_12810 [Calditrichota bacterium]
MSCFTQLKSLRLFKEETENKFKQSVRIFFRGGLKERQNQQEIKLFQICVATAFNFKKYKQF